MSVGTDVSMSMGISMGGRAMGWALGQAFSIVSNRIYVTKWVRSSSNAIEKRDNTILTMEAGLTEIGPIVLSNSPLSKTVTQHAIECKEDTEMCGLELEPSSTIRFHWTPCAWRHNQAF